MPLDYETLRLLWWAVLGVLLIGIAVMDGFDMGAAILMPIIGHNDTERRIIINTIGPVWEGNQVWLVLGGGAIFAAWPPLYATAFSGFYFAMLLLLVALILRPVGFKFRGKVNNQLWRNVWDTALFVGGFVPALVFGVAFGNVLQGVPFSFDETLRVTYAGTLLALFNPFALLCGLVSVAMITMHGAAYLACKTDAAVRKRASAACAIAACTLVILFALGGLWARSIDFYAVSGAQATDGPSNPLLKSVVRAPGALLANYAHYRWMLAAPLAGFLGAAVAALLAFGGRRPLIAFTASALSIAGVIATAGVSMFPFLLPSSSAPQSSLTVWDASSSVLTLTVMTIVTGVLLPIVLAYTAWVYRVLRAPVTAESLARDDHAY